MAVVRPDPQTGPCPFLALALVTQPDPLLGQATAAALRTPAEQSGFTRHTGHDEMVAYRTQVQALASDMRVGSYGRTLEGRDLPYAIVSRPHVTSPAEAHATGGPVVVLGANAHGHNYVGCEALLVLLRELGSPAAAMNRLLDSVIVSVVPSKNPDGLAMVQYGGAYPYHLLYQGPGLAGADATWTELVDEQILPHVAGALEGDRFQSFYWSRGGPDRWLVGGAAPRMGRN